MTNLFPAHSLEENVNTLAAYLPNDKLFAAKGLQNTNLRGLLQGLGGELTTLDQTIANTELGLNLLETQDLDFIAAWEVAVGIPNTYFPNTTSLGIEARRNQILIQLRSLGVLTAQDFIDLAALLGIAITIDNGIDMGVFPLVFPLPFFLNPTEARFIMIVNAPTELRPSSFEMTFPITFSSTESSILETLFNILKPAPTKIIFNYIL
jgi:uncharacterized protein YmfQ (DUF2313 family)